MMRSLYSGISGLKNHQTRMDVIGNNIANVNTVGYKTSRTIFQDIFSQSVKGGMANIGVVGGTNPVQIGLGIKLSTIDVLHTPAPFQRTDNPFDMMISGDGYFIVQGPEGYFYTRAGNFGTDDLGFLVTSEGFYVMGFTADMEKAEMTDRYGNLYVPTIWGAQYAEDSDATGVNYELGLRRIQLRVYDEDFYEDGVLLTGEEYWNMVTEWEDWDETTGPPWVDLLGFTVSNDGSIEVIINNRKVTIAQLGIGMFSNPNGLEKAGGNLYRETSSSGDVVITTAYNNGAGKVEGGGLEMSNVDLASEFTDMIVTQRGFQANSRIITVSDTLLEELINLKR